MEDNKTMELEFVENEDIEVYDEPKKSGSKLGVLAVIAAVVGGTAVYLHATKGKREAKRIEKLRKKGYVVYEPVEAEPVQFVEVTESDK